jgi:plasmid stabilization system protein ParE
VRKYRVIVTPEAQAGIRSAFDYIRERAPLNAARWLQGLYQQIDTLEGVPERCGFARERKYFEDDLRRLIFKSHRIVFQIDEQQHTVHVLYVRHAKRRAVGETETDPSE